MNFTKVTQNNIQDLYQINRQLAIEENQTDLFTATLENYSKGFLSDNSIAQGILAYQNNKLIGFAICNYKFATYLGFKVLYIEDIYLNPEFATDENKSQFLKHLIDLGFSENCCRIEMRVLKSVNWGTNLIKSFGFDEITKWSVYRLSK